MKNYLFVHFKGSESGESEEQIYFAVSRDGRAWENLNNGQPILTSTLGEKGVRDPHIVRSPDGDKFFLIATDLSIYARRNQKDCWTSCQTAGSRSVMVWESSDLVSWSEQRMVKIAPDSAGCAWAPESIYDDEKDMYMVFWASKTSDDNFTNQRIYRSYTTDFRSFTEPEVYIDGGEKSRIDTTIVKDDGVYYRFTKNETDRTIIMDRCKSLSGKFEPVAYTINGKPGESVSGYEGPTAYKDNDGKWCLLLDNFAKSKGYIPFITNDISKGTFEAAENFSAPDIFRHGTVMPITENEYDRLCKAYGK